MRPSRISIPGSGSFGPFIATSPSSGAGETSSSLRSSRASRSTKRLERRLTDRREQAAARVNRLRLADERRCLRGAELVVEAARPRLQLVRARPVRAKRRVDLEEHLVVDRCQLGRALEAVCELDATGRPRDLRLEAERLRRRAHLGGAEPARPQGIERQVLEPEPSACPDEVGSLRAEWVVGPGVEGHDHSLDRPDISRRVADFSGRTALVTGGASGIGAATTALLRALGARVAIYDLDASSAQAELTISGDVTDSAQVDAAVARVEEELGPLNVLVCSAGIGGE